MSICRQLLKLTLAPLTLCLWVNAAPAADSPGYAFKQVVIEAKQLAAAPFHPPEDQLPKALADLDYDQWRRIVYWRRQQLWAHTALSFRAEFFHPGYIYRHRPAIRIVTNDHAHRLPFATSLFQYGGTLLPNQVPPHLGFAGFKLLYPLNQPRKYDELISFLGASYFRALGAHQYYGSSARALAINTTNPTTPESFPFFRAFWIHRPQLHDDTCRIDALLDSPTVCGAYRFTVHPGRDTLVDVHAELFARHTVEQLGIAPVGSMFLYGENTHKPADDPRPEVHDADGLLMHHQSGEWIWRPLTNPGHITVNTFALGQLQGFGLMQRDRHPEHYKDGEAFYQFRPSVWITPQSPWPAGSVQLLQIPSHREGEDNIVAFYAPAVPLRRGEHLSLRYQIHWRSAPPASDNGGHVLSTHIDYRNSCKATFRICFSDPSAHDTPQRKIPTLVVTAAHSRVTDTSVLWDSRQRAWKAIFTVTCDRRESVELRAFLKRSLNTLTETWSYTWTHSRHN